MHMKPKIDGFFLLKLAITRTYHQEVVEEKDLPLVHPGPLRPVGVRNFIKLTATHQPPVGEGQHLEGVSSGGRVGRHGEMRP